jgi:hypothetical protein
MAKKKGEKPDKTEQVQALPATPARINGKFAKGHSGNPAGMPPGTTHRVTRAAEALLEGQAEAITQKAIDAALGGDTLAIRICMNRICPARRDRNVNFEAPDLKRPEDAMQAIGAIVNGVAAGNLTVPEAAGIANIVAWRDRRRCQGTRVAISNIVSLGAPIGETE